MRYEDQIAQARKDVFNISSRPERIRFMRRAIWDRIREDGDDEDLQAARAIFHQLIGMFPDKIGDIPAREVT